MTPDVTEALRPVLPDRPRARPVGERWSLLVVRELIDGPKRYTDLVDGLPGIGTNILAARLRDLEAGGIVQKRKLPPPAASTVYELTDYGARARGGAPRARALGSTHARPARSDEALGRAGCRTRSRRSSIPPRRGIRRDVRASASATKRRQSARQGRVDVTRASPRTTTSWSRPTARRFYGLARGRLVRRQCLVDGDRELLARAFDASATSRCSPLLERSSPAHSAQHVPRQSTSSSVVRALPTASRST